MEAESEGFDVSLDVWSSLLETQNTLQNVVDM